MWEPVTLFTSIALSLLGALTLGPYTDRCLANESVLGQLAGRTEMSAPSADSASH